jgi:hypothetical protein
MIEAVEEISSEVVIFFQGQRQNEKVKNDISLCSLLFLPMDIAGIHRYPRGRFSPGQKTVHAGC